MGLMIHYEFHAPNAKTEADVMHYITQLHAFAKTLGFDDVTDLMPWKQGDKGCNFDLLFQYYFSGEKAEGEEEAPIYSVAPREIICFMVLQPGSDPGAIGLALHEDIAVDCSTGERRPAQLVGWNWRHFCKTQFASLSQEGGFDNFFTVHDGMCRIMDEAKRIGLDVKVTDEGGYFENRDKEKLRAEINRWNGMMAALTGHLKDKLGAGAVQAAMDGTPEFERLEAQGQSFLPQISEATEVVRRTLDQEKEGE